MHKLNDVRMFELADIDWDTDDGCCPDFISCTIDVSCTDINSCKTEDVFNELLSDILSDTYGFAVKSFTYKQL